MGKRLPTTPRSRIKSALRMVWIKIAGNTCSSCGRKGSVAKGREVKIEVHHKDGIFWDGLVDEIIKRMLPDPSKLEVLCKDCHGLHHEKEKCDLKK
ncbi:MAG: hypothetical protein WC373_12585 [Smithella sp.]|jgi:predicted HNH restriction endonuclease